MVFVAESGTTLRQVWR